MICNKHNILWGLVCGGGGGVGGMLFVMLVLDNTRRVGVHDRVPTQHHDSRTKGIAMCDEGIPLHIHVVGRVFKESILCWHAFFKLGRMLRRK